MIPRSATAGPSRRYASTSAPVPPYPCSRRTSGAGSDDGDGNCTVTGRSPPTTVGVGVDAGSTLGVAWGALAGTIVADGAPVDAQAPVTRLTIRTRRIG